MGRSTTLKEAQGTSVLQQGAMRGVGSLNME